MGVLRETRHRADKAIILWSRTHHAPLPLLPGSLPGPSSLPETVTEVGAKASKPTKRIVNGHVAERVLEQEGFADVFSMAQ